MPSNYCHIWASNWLCFEASPGDFRISLFHSCLRAARSRQVSSSLEILGLHSSFVDKACFLKADVSRTSPDIADQMGSEEIHPGRRCSLLGKHRKEQKWCSFSSQVCQLDHATRLEDIEKRALDTVTVIIGRIILFILRNLLLCYTYLQPRFQGIYHPSV